MPPHAMAPRVRRAPTKTYTHRSVTRRQAWPVPHRSAIPATALPAVTRVHHDAATCSWSSTALPEWVCACWEPF
jgi:hypothetical protein